MAGMIITFCFLVLYTAVQPFCTPSLSKTQACCLISQFFSLFSGICLIVNSYIEKDLMNAGVPDSTVQSSGVFRSLIVVVNLIICAWPVVLVIISGEFAKKWDVFSAKFKSLMHPQFLPGSESIPEVKEPNSTSADLGAITSESDCMKQESSVAIDFVQPATHADNVECDITDAESLQCTLQLSLQHHLLPEWNQTEMMSDAFCNLGPSPLPPTLMPNQTAREFSSPPFGSGCQFVWLIDPGSSIKES
jgi:hypothetical protein